MNHYAINVKHCLLLGLHNIIMLITYSPVTKEGAKKLPFGQAVAGLY